MAKIKQPEYERCKRDSWQAIFSENGIWLYGEKNMSLFCIEEAIILQQSEARGYVDIKLHIPLTGEYVIQGYLHKIKFVVTDEIQDWLIQNL